MKAFGLSNDTCNEFLHKMSTIADLSQGTFTWQRENKIIIWRFALSRSHSVLIFLGQG